MPKRKPAPEETKPSNDDDEFEISVKKGGSKVKPAVEEDDEFVITKKKK